LGVTNENSELLLVNLKGSINGIDAYQKLLGFQLPDIYPNPLVALSMRLNRLEFLDALQKAQGEERDVLETVRTSARIRLEDQGHTALERLGINDRLYRSLTQREEFLKEFTGDREEIFGELHRFLSSTL